MNEIEEACKNIEILKRLIKSYFQNFQDLQILEFEEMIKDFKNKSLSPENIFRGVIGNTFENIIEHLDNIENKDHIINQNKKTLDSAIKHYKKTNELDVPDGDNVFDELIETINGILSGENIAQALFVSHMEEKYKNLPKSKRGTIYETKDGYEYYVTKDKRISFNYFTQIKTLSNSMIEAIKSDPEMVGDIDFLIRAKAHCFLEAEKEEDRIITEKTTVLITCINITLTRIGINFRDSRGIKQETVDDSEQTDTKLMLNYLLMNTLRSLLDVNSKLIIEDIRKFSTAEEALNIIYKVITLSQGFFEKHLLKDLNFCALCLEENN